MWSRCFLAFLALTAGACAGPAAQPKAREPEPREPVAAAPVLTATVASQDASSAPASPRPTLELVSLPVTPAPNPPAVIEIKFPILGQLVPSAKAKAFKVRLKVENWPLAARGAGVEIALDEHPPQRVLALETPLGSLNGQLTPGEHLLVAWAVRETGEVVRPPAGASRAPFAAVRFSIGESRSSSPPAEIKGLRYVSPTGTINGDRAADALLVDFLPLSLELSPTAPLRVKIEGAGAGAPPWTAELERPAWAPVGVKGLPNGDWKITLEQGTNRAERVITVNRDLAPALVR